MSVQKASSVQFTRHRFTVAEYERMGQVGTFSEDERVELVCGEVVEMPPLGERHAACVAWLVNLRGRRVKAYADPTGGVYQTVTSYARGEEMESRALAALRVSVADILG